MGEGSAGSEEYDQALIQARRAILRAQELAEHARRRRIVLSQAPQADSHPDGDERAHAVQLAGGIASFSRSSKIQDHLQPSSERPRATAAACRSTSECLLASLAPRAELREDYQAPHRCSLKPNGSDLLQLEPSKAHSHNDPISGDSSLRRSTAANTGLPPCLESGAGPWSAERADGTEHAGALCCPCGTEGAIWGTAACCSQALQPGSQQSEGPSVETLLQTLSSLQTHQVGLVSLTQAVQLILQAYGWE